MENGARWFEKRDYRRALAEFRIAAQNAPADPEPLYRQALILLAARSSSLALSKLDATLRLNPNHPGALLEIARIEVESDAPATLRDAASVLSRLSTIPPRNAEVFSMLATVYAKLGIIEEARAAFDTALTRPDVQLADVCRPIAALARRGDVTSARAFMARAVAHRSNSPDLMVAQADLEFAEGHRNTALAVIAATLAVKPRFPPALQLRLRIETLANEIAQAQATARELANLPDPATRDSLARFLLATNRPELAVAEYKRLRTTFPDMESVQVAYMDLLLQVGNRAEVRAELRTLFASREPTPALLMLRANLNLDERNLEAAAADLKSLDLLTPFTDRGSWLHARLAAARGDLLGATVLYAETLRLNPAFLPARLDLARSLIASGHPEAALSYLDGATAEQKKMPEFTTVCDEALVANN